MFESVADYEIIHVEDQVVAGNLIKYFLCDGYGGALVFNDYLRLAGFVIDDTVASATHSIELYGLLVSYM